MPVLATKSLAARDELRLSARAVPRPAPLRLFWRALACLVASVSCLRGADALPPINPRLTGTPLMQIWQAEDYEGSPINWRVLQHPKSGFIYAGNNFDVLEFDGAAWRQIAMPRDASARALAVDGQGTIWAAGAGYIARLQPDNTGTLEAAEITAQLPESERLFGLINRAIASRRTSFPS